MEENLLKEYRKVWNEKIQILKNNLNVLSDNECYWVNICAHAMERFNELTRLQSETLNDIYKRFVNKNG
jgi:hypothetical protein